ncbi:MAG: ribosome biogenesis GTP-binding protein YihA/YsxC [Planctomycetota bacterium]
MSRALQVQFLAAVVDVDALPATRAEVAFLGRSNVGKSSLLNALAGQKRLAPVSATPGRTQVLACFQLDRSGATLVDCPGYGYAQVAKQQRHSWPAMLERYLLERENLTRALLLIDGEIGPTESDLRMLAWLREHDVPIALVATKHDKVKSSHRDRRAREVAAACAVEPGEVVWVSADEDYGISELRQLVRDWLA